MTQPTYTETMTPTHTDMVRALTAVYRRATDDDIAGGRAWYPQANRAMRRTARRTGVTLRRAVCTMAITSPDAQLTTNVRWTETACETRGEAKVGRYPNSMHARYAPVLRGEVLPLNALNGPKIRAFYRAILGDEAAVVVDRWALRAASWTRITVTPLQYERVAAAYTEAAGIVGETPRDFQAIVWTVVRRETGIQYTDIHDH